MKKNIYSAFGLNQREIFDQTSNAWKMMWEQLLMIAIYARQQYMQSNQSNADNFQQRMKMVHLLIREYHRYRAGSNPSFDKDIPEIFQKVLALIEDECGSTKIIEFLLDEEVSQFQTSKKRILSQMEQAKIAFSPTPAGYKRDYSYYSLYEILYDPIFYISKLMSIPVPDKQAIHSTVVITVYDYLVKNNRLLLLNENPMERNFKSIEDKELIILKNLSLLQGKDDIKKLVKGQIADFIGTDVYKVFNLLSDPFYNEENPQNKLFASVFTIRPEADEFNISLDRKALINLINLNQLDELALVMKSEIKKVVLNKNQGTRNFGIETKVDQASALEKISEWYIKAQTGLFNRVDQVPKLIASILEFDIRYFKGMFDPELGFDRSLLTKNHKNSYSPLQAKEIYLFVSAYIRNKLYYNDPRPDRNSLHGLLINHLVERDFPEDIFFHKNRMMETWATFEDEKQHQKMLDRFKRMPPYLDPQHKDYTEISYLINKQKELGNDENAPPYPLNSFFPLPLWASRFSKNNIVEEVPNKLS